MIVKFRGTPQPGGEHVDVRVFMGRREGALALTGRLTMRTDEWAALGALEQYVGDTCRDCAGYGRAQIGYRPCATCSRTGKPPAVIYTLADD